MKKVWKKFMTFTAMSCMVFSLVACGNTEKEKENDAVSGSTTTTEENNVTENNSTTEPTSESIELSELANDYYIDLADFGMKLTIYLRLEENGNFMLSNALDFETNKGSGIFQKADDSYVMVYTSVNGEEKSVSDGITASFTVTEEGTLDFSASCNRSNIFVR